MLETLVENIQTLKLTKTDKKIADFFIKKIDELFLYSSKDIATILNVSDTSIIRFIKLLGFKGYRDFKNYIKIQTTKKLKPEEKLLKNSEILTSNNLESNFLNEIEKNIQILFKENIKKKFVKTEELLKKSSKTFIVGFKSTSGISSFLGLRLGYLYENVHTFSLNSSEVIKSFYDIKKDDLLILITFPKYSKTYDILLEIAKDRGANIIIITDSISSPHYNKGDVTLLAPTKGISFFNSLVSAQILIEYLLTFLTKNLNSDQQKRVSKLDEYLSKNKV